MSTPNLDLQTIEMSDNLKTDFVRKINSNMEKLDEKYLELTNSLLEKTGQQTLEDALAIVDGLINLKNLTATPNKILNGYTAFANGSLVTGTALRTTTTATASDIVKGKTAYNNNGNLLTGTISKMPIINVELTGDSSYKGLIEKCGASMSNDGTLIIWAISNSTAYENIKFENTSIAVGTIDKGWNNTGFSNNPLCVFGCTVTGLSNYNTLNVTLHAYGRNSTNDYVTLQVTLTAS